MAHKHITDFIGRPWQKNHHCWTLVQEVYREMLCVELPEHPVAIADPVWLRIDEPVDLCVVALSRGSKPVKHAGIFYQGHVLHCVRPQSVLSPLHDLPRLGYDTIIFLMYEPSLHLFTESV